jgi:hypothetical protein
MPILPLPLLRSPSLPFPSSIAVTVTTYGLGRTRRRGFLFFLFKKTPQRGTWAEMPYEHSWSVSGARKSHSCAPNTINILALGSVPERPGKRPLLNVLTGLVTAGLLIPIFQLTTSHAK